MREKKSAGMQSQNQHDEVADIIMLILDQVRFLVKSDYYRDEMEYRVIKYSSGPECDNSQEEIPTIYINMTKPLRYKEICLGPKIKDTASVGSYILNLKREPREGSVSPDTIVRKSLIPYQ